MINLIKSNYTKYPKSCNKEYNGFIFNQSLSKVCGIISILELLYLQNTLNDISNINIMDIYKYNNSKCRNNTILDFIKSIKEYLNIDIYDIHQCITEDSLLENILYNQGVILNIKTSDILRQYNSKYIIDIYKKNITYNNSNHSILAYGYNIIDNKLYLHILNSYGKLYGNNGSIYLDINYPMNEYPYTFKSRIKNKI